MSSSLNYAVFMYQMKNNFQSTIKRIHSSSDIDVGILAIVIHNEGFNLVKITAFNNLAQEVQVLHYEPLFPSTTFYVSRSNRNTSNISIQNIVLHHPIVEKQDVHLNFQQFHEIESICKEF